MTYFKRHGPYISTDQLQNELPANAYALQSAVVFDGTNFVEYTSDGKSWRSHVAAPAIVTTPVSILVQPSPTTALVGSSATFTVVVNGTTPSYQWSRNPGGNTSFAAIAGANSATYTTPGVAMFGGTANNGDTYRVAISNAYGPTVTSSIVALTASSGTGADTASPVLSGSITATSITQTSYTLTWSAGTDNVGITSYQYSLDAGTSYTSVGTALTINIAGRTAGATDAVRVRAFDAAGNPSNVLSANVTLQSASVVPYDVVLLAGQSNMAGRGTKDAGIDTVSALVDQFDSYAASGTYRTIIQAADRLQHSELGSLFAGNVNLTGPGLSFAKAYAARTGRRVLLVPVAFGGTGLVPGYAPSVAWSPYGSQNTQYLAAIDQANRAITAANSAAPGSAFVGVLWFQGEADGSASAPGGLYTTTLLDMITGLRAGISGGATSWFVASRLVPEAVATNGGGSGTYALIDAALQNAMSATVRGGIITARSGFCTDNLHYTAAGTRLAGADFDAAVPAALAYSPTAPGQVTTLAQSSSTSTSITVTFAAPSTGGFVLDYAVEYSSDGGTTWSVAADGTSRALTATISGFTASSSYSVRVRAANTGSGGTQYGTYSSTITATTAAAATPVNVQFTAATGLTESGDGTVGWSYTGATGATFAANHAGISSHKLPAGVDGSFQDTYVSTMNAGNLALLGITTSASNPVYDTSGAGYLYGILNHTSGAYRVTQNSGAASIVATTAVTPQTGDIRRLRRTAGVWVAEVARAVSPTAFTVIYTFATNNNADVWCAMSLAVSGTATTIGPIVGVAVV